MYLFNESGEVIEVYEMIPQKSLITQYKMKEMSKIAERERVYFATTTSGKPLLNEGPFTIRD